jgi:O-acetyl-ADP-ribose deacetylase
LITSHHAGDIPEYRGGGYCEADLLASCYREALRLAMEAGLKTIAFPCISTGVFFFPPEEACSIAVSTVVEWLATHELPQQVTFCCFSHTDVKLYRKRLGV